MTNSIKMTYFYKNLLKFHIYYKRRKKYIKYHFKIDLINSFNFTLSILLMVYAHVWLSMDVYFFILILSRNLYLNKTFSFPMLI